MNLGWLVVPLILHRLFLNCASFCDRSKLSMSFLTQSNQVFSRRPHCLIPSISHIIQHLTQSLSPLCSTYPSHLNLLFLIIKLTGSKSSLEFFTLLSFIQLNHTTHTYNHTHIKQFSFNLCSTFIDQISTVIHQTTPHTISICLAFQF